MKITGTGLSIYDIYDIAVKDEPVQLDPKELEKVRGAFDRVQAWGEARYPIYGVTTGFGEMIHVIIPPKFKSDLQCNLLRSHSAGGGEPFCDQVVRAIIAVRLNCLMKGRSGVSPQALEMLQHFLNHHIHPVIPQQGSLGASGDLAPLSHMALPLIGGGLVRRNGQVYSSAEVLEQEGLEPLKPGFKEGLALVNGTSAMTAAACIALVRAYKLVKLAIVATADLLQCLGGSTRPFDARGHELKNHAGQIVIAQALRQLLTESILTREHSDIMQSIVQRTADSEEVTETEIYLQDAYSLRCIPQVLGPVLDTMNLCRRFVEEELNSCNDNPLIFETPEETFHGANFHGQYVAMACDFLNVSLAEIGVLAERQLDRLVSPHLNGNLPPFLACGQSGLFCGFEGGQYLATSLVSENMDLAAPASIKSIPSNGANQDIVSMGLIAARKSLRLCDHVSTILTVLVAACYQASHFVGQEKFNSPIKEWHQALSPLMTFYQDDTPLADVFHRIQAFVTSAEGWAYLDSTVDLDERQPAANRAYE